MKTLNIKKAALILGVAAVSLMPVRVAYAGGIPVFDGAGFAKNLISNIHEAIMIKNQVVQLENDLKNLTSLDFDILEDYSQSMNDLFSKMGEVHGLMQELGDLQGKFEELYPDFNNIFGEYSEEKASATLSRALDESRQMMLGAAKTGQVVLQNLPKTQLQLEELISDSQAAPGILQAAQAGNQINATISGNLMQLNGLMTQFVQAYTSFTQKQNLEQAINIQKSKKINQGENKSNEPPVPFTLF